MSPVTGRSDPNFQQFEEIGNQIAESFEKTGIQQINLDQKGHKMDETFIVFCFFLPFFHNKLMYDKRNSK